MKTALICRGAGFIGGHLINRLKKIGYSVRGVDLKENEYGNDKADDFMMGIGEILMLRKKRWKGGNNL